MELLSASKAFGGSQRVYRHDSAACACPMSFAIYLPHQAEEGPVPVLWYLSGLTCTHQNVMDKGESRAAAAASETDRRERAKRTGAAQARREQQRKAAELESKLKAEIAALGQDRAKLNQQLIDIAGRVRGIETGIADTEGRLRPLDARELQIRASLDSRRGEIAEVLAALQRAGRHAPPALLVRPEDALQSLRTAMLLGAVVPEMRARAAKLAGDLGELVSLRKTISEERDRLAADRDRLNEDRARLAALVQERCFYHLEAPIERVTGFDTPYPHSLEWAYFPGPVRIGMALKKILKD